jgi:hypothetical protein
LLIQFYPHLFLQVADMVVVDKFVWCTTYGSQSIDVVVFPLVVYMCAAAVVSEYA